jgi:hypothetical protein
MTQLPSKVNPPVELENDGIVLNSGLDLTTSSLQVDKGALRDCLNIEVVDRLGYQVIGGFDRYDGSLSPDQVEFWVIELDLDESPFPPDAGDKFRSVATPTRLYGTIVERIVGDTQQWLVFGRNQSDVMPEPAEPLETYDTLGSTLAFESLNAPVRYRDFAPTTETAADIYAKYATWNAVLRTKIDSLPSQPIGTHWYRDRLYVVADELRLGFQNAGGLISGPPSVTVRIIPNMILRSQDGSFCCRVLKVEASTPDSAWATSSANGIFLVEPLEFFNGVGLVFNGVPPTSGLFDALYEIPDSLNWNVGSNEFFTGLFTARAVTASDPVPAYAGLWRSNKEPTPGWEYVETGWKLSYENGFSFSNALREVERSVDNNFQFDTDDQEGLSALWFNGTDLAPENTEITPNDPGWSTSAAIAVDDETLQSEDDDYLIGDIDFGVRAVDGLTTRIANALVNNQPASVSQRLAGVPTIPLPDTGNALAGFSSARTPMMFLGLGPILDLIPQDAQISGLEVRGRIKKGFGCRGLMPSATYTTVADAEQALLDQVSTLFQCSAQFGEYDPATGKFNTRGQKRGMALSLPAARASYTSTSSASTNHDIRLTYSDASKSDLLIGSSTDLFGLVNFDREDFDKNEFGMVLYGESLSNPVPGVEVVANSADPFGLVGVCRLSFDSLVIRVYYDQPSARYFVKEGTKVLSFDLVSNTVTSGQLRDGTAKGDLQVVNVQSVTTGADFKSTILGGDEIYLNDPLGPDPRKVGDVAGTSGQVAMELNGLPALKDIIAAGSRYQFITANFFAREDWDGFYGVSGAGKAFSFAAFDADDDGDEEQYLQFIYTNTIVPDEDKPRHVAFHQYHLALGYRDGTVRFSVPGEPENYDGLLGAAEVGVGDRVTGLLGMRGKALGVFCDGSIYTILGDNADTFNVETLAPKTGAIEYTVVDMGIPLYCDNRGISTLEQSQKYGNFVGVRISQRVSPWILPRMTRSDDLFSLNQGAGVVCAVPVRAKNQYRLFFRDGRVLILTMNGDGSLAFTYAFYYLNEAESQFLVPIAHSSQVDNDGRERIHMAHYSPRSTISTADSRYVYEFENGLGFDGDWFDWSYTTAFAYKDPFKDNTIRKVNVDGLTKGASWATITVAKDYDEDSYSTTLVPLNLPRNPSAVPSVNFKPSSVMANVAKEGRSLSFRVQRSSAIKTLTPPIVHQALLVQYQSGGKRDS